MMTLAKYLKDKKLTQRDFAVQLGVSASYLNEIVRQVKLPRMTLAADIERLTKGEVPVAAWVPKESRMEGAHSAPDHEGSA